MTDTSTYREFILSRIAANEHAAANLIPGYDRDAALAMAEDYRLQLASFDASQDPAWQLLTD